MENKEAKNTNEELNQEEILNNQSADNATGEDNTPTENEQPAEAPVEVDPLEAAQGEIAELKKQLLYKAAEFDNYRKRVIKEK